MHPSYIFVAGISLPHLGQVFFYGLHEGENPILSVKVVAHAVHHQANVHVLDTLVLFIREEYKEYSHETAVRVPLNTLSLEAVVINQALQVSEGDSLHVQGVQQWLEVDVPEMESLIAGHHVLG